MRRRRILTLTTGTIILGGGCIELPSRGNEPPSEDNESPSEGRIFLEVRNVNESEENARITDYECVSQSSILKRALDEAIEGDSATTEISSAERDEISETLKNCYSSDQGAIYIQHDKEVFKLEFFQQQ